MAEYKSFGRARHPELYRDDAVHGVDYEMSHTEVYETYSDDGKPSFGLCIERVPVQRPASIPENRPSLPPAPE